MGIDVLDIVAIIFGVLFTVRKLDAQSRQPEEFAHVPPAAFLDWQRREVRLYTVAVTGCFLKVFLDFGFTYFFVEKLDYSQARLIGAFIDVSWLILLVYTFVRAARLSKLRRQLGILLGGFLVSGQEEEEEPEQGSSSSKDA